MIRFPNAKINLGLRVLRKRRDGFHDIETVFMPVGLCDALEVVPAKGQSTRVYQTGIALDNPPQDNICHQAWELMHLEYGVPHVDIHLHKAIPAGAGLGGGSADGSYTLLMLNEMYDFSLNSDQLEELASRLGSDCAFFIHNKPMLGTGRGDVLSPLPCKMPDMYLLLANPGIHVPTATAYKNLKPRQSGKSLTELLKNPVEKWKEMVHNDFENTIFGQFPQIKQLKEQMYQMGAIYAQMSGSGASVFGLFAKQPSIPGCLDKQIIWQSPVNWS